VSSESLVELALAGEPRALGRLLSLIEDGGDEVGGVMRALYPHTGRAYSVGITGAPGAGKSTLGDRLVACARSDGLPVGVLAVDPSSPFSGGALLGDRVRMQTHATDPGVFIRSMATRGHLGGISLATPEAVRVLDAAGKQLVVIETVGVGQAEVEITDACDTTLVVVNPGWGDAVQAAKAGLMEIADVFVINKADREGTRSTERELRQMLELSGAEQKPEIVKTVATKAEGIGELWSAVKRHRSFQEQDGRLQERRRRRLRREIAAIAAERYRALLVTSGAELLSRLTNEVEERRIDPYAAADRLMGEIRGRRPGTREDAGSTPLTP
jgi:GTPase